MRLSKAGVRLNIFMLEESEGLASLHGTARPAHARTGLPDGRPSGRGLRRARLRDPTLAVGSGMRRAVKVLLWIAVFAACFGVGAYVAAHTDPFPPGVDDPGATAGSGSRPPRRRRGGDRVVQIEHAHVPRPLRRAAAARSTGGSSWGSRWPTVRSSGSGAATAARANSAVMSPPRRSRPMRIELEATGTLRGRRAPVPVDDTVAVARRCPGPVGTA